MAELKRTGFRERRKDGRGGIASENKREKLFTKHFPTDQRFK